MNIKLIFIAIILFVGYQFLYKASKVNARTIDNNCDAVIFTTSTCPYCAQALKLLKKERVAWCERDINKSSENYKLFKQLGGRGVPLAVIGSQVLKGFSEYDYKDAINKI